MKIDIEKGRVGIRKLTITGAGLDIPIMENNIITKSNKVRIDFSKNDYNDFIDMIIENDKDIVMERLEEKEESDKVLVPKPLLEKIKNEFEYLNTKFLKIRNDCNKKLYYQEWINELDDLLKE